MLKEYQEQQKLVNWLKINNIFHFATNNENQMSAHDKLTAVKIEAKAKSMGKAKGASDLVVMLPDCIIFIELKRTKKSLSKVYKEQLVFLEKVNSFGYARGCIAYGAEEAIRIVESFL